MCHFFTVESPIYFIAQNSYNEFIYRFLHNFTLERPFENQIKQIWHELRRIILVFIVKKSYLRMSTNRLLSFDANKNQEINEYKLNNFNFIRIKK